MAARSTTMESRTFASPALKALIGQRSAEFGGFFLGMAGVALLIALLTYNPLDPSLDTATTRHATNMAGQGGAMLADLLLQGFGLAGVLPGIALLTWAWRVASHRGIGSVGLRLVCLLTALPLLAAMFAAIPALHALGWPTTSGLGGAIGLLLSQAALDAGHALFGPVGTACVATVGAIVAAGLTVMSLGLSRGEWKSAGKATAAAARFGVSGGIGAASALARGSRHVAPSAWLSNIVSRTEPMEPEVPVAAPLVRRPAAPKPADPGPVAMPPARRTLSDDDIDGVPPPRAFDAPSAEEPEETPPPPAATGAVPIVHARKPAPAARKPVQESLALPESAWRMPPLTLLKKPPARVVTGPTEEALQGNARLLESVLAEYGVQGSIVEIRPGPVVTLYELEPAPGIRSARVIGLADDVARSLSVIAVRIATVPGRNVIGIEVPNARRETVYLSEILSSEEVTNASGKLVLALGKNIGGTSIVADLARMPHLMIAGTTGSGKSVGVNAMILSLLYRMSPDQCRLILIDPKMLELSIYEGIPHLLSPVVTEPAKAVIALKWTVREMERRYRAMSQLGVRNVGGYNDRVAEARAKGEVVTRKVQTGFDPDTGAPVFEEQPLALETLPFIVVVVDEMADLMMVAGKDIEQAVQRLAQMARAAGIHVIMATQRPSVDVITGTIKANFPTRISFQVISKFDSRTILGEQGAEQLLGMGDMLFMPGAGRISRIHGPFVSDEEVEAVVAFLREQGEPAYVEEVTEAPDPDASPSSILEASDGEKSLFDQAVSVVAREGKASTSFIQRHLNIGYNRAAKLIEQMEKEGIITQANHAGKREILVRRTHDED
jgi:DNA segregation ATPase FtsK/SpoIIIE, S-DNA-T family